MSSLAAFLRDLALRDGRILVVGWLGGKVYREKMKTEIASDRRSRDAVLSYDIGCIF